MCRECHECFDDDEEVREYRIMLNRKLTSSQLWKLHTHFSFEHVSIDDVTKVRSCAKCAEPLENDEQMKLHVKEKHVVSTVEVGRQ